MASVFESLGTTIAAKLRSANNLGLTVIERKSTIRLDKDTQPAVYVAPVSETPVGYCFGGIVIVEYSFDVVIVSKGDQQLDPPEMTLAPNRVELVRLALDVPLLPGMPTIRENRWQLISNLYDRSALGNNYDRAAMRFFWKSDEPRS